MSAVEERLVPSCMKRKAILLGIDGATWSILAPAVESGKLPQFRRLLSQSTVGVNRSTMPPDSPPAWTSIFTGVNPGKHGIVDFELREKDGFVRCYTRYRMCKSIWEIISEANLKCIVLNNPVSYPPESINGIMTSGLLTPPGSNNWVHPIRLKSELDAVANGYECDIPPDFSRNSEDHATSGTEKLKNLAVKLHRVSKHLVAAYDWDILAVIFTTTDRLQHFWWDDPASILEHYQALDTILTDYVKIADDNSADLIVVSDHGFGPIKHAISMPNWLEKEGLVSYSETVSSKTMSRFGLTKPQIGLWLKKHPRISSLLPEFLGKVAKHHLPEGRHELNPLNTIAFMKNPAGVFVEDKTQLGYVEGKLRGMTYEGSPVFESVLRRESVLSGPYVYRAPDLMLQPSEGFLVHHKRGPESTYLPKTNGMHRPEGIYIHYRPGMKVAPTVGTIRPWDISATILEILNVPIPSYFDGKPILLKSTLD